MRYDPVVKRAGTGGVVVQPLEARRLLSAGVEDASFGSGGRALLPDRSIYYASFATTPDGHLLIAGGVGESFDPTFHASKLARLTADGVLDASFGAGGFRELPASIGSPSDRSDLTVLPDGRALALWNAAPTLLVRFKPDGALDPTFADGGVVHTELSPDAAVKFAPGALVVQGNNYVVAGNVGDKLLLARFTSSGQLDLTFGTGGKALVTFPGGLDVGDLLLQRDGRLVVTGTSSNPANPDARSIALARFTAKGQLDSTFGSGGRVIAGYETDFYGVARAAVQSDGRILVVGTQSRTGPGAEWTSDMLVARFNTDGSLDRTFSPGGTEGDGRAVIDFAHNRDDGGAILLQPDGKILVGGDSWVKVGETPNLPNAFALARLRPDGSLDATFGGGAAGAGKVVSLFTPSATCRSLALQADGRIVAVGSTDLNPIGPGGTDVALVRYLNDIPPVDRVSAAISGNVLTISGTPGNDTIRATVVNGAVAIDGVAQRFPLGMVTRIRVVGYAGNDRIDLSALAIPSSVSGDDGDDTVYGSQLADTLYGGNANDWLNGQGGNDFLGGDAGADNIEGATGNDTMDGGVGPDRLSGGAGMDTADYHGRSAALWLSLDNVANDGEARVVGGSLQTREADNVIDNVEVLLGGSGNDLLLGGTHDDTLFGGAGDDTLRGGAGNDYLNGGPGRDQLFGDSGNDQFFSRDGMIDRLDGGAGFDRATVDANDLRGAIEALLA
jgi:uncharacterized delta-60 repeat protein